MSNLLEWREVTPEEWQRMNRWRRGLQWVREFYRDLFPDLCEDDGLTPEQREAQRKAYRKDS